MEEIKGNSAIILGYGREGKSLFKYLNSHYPHLTIAVADEKELDFPQNTQIYTGENYLEKISTYDTIIRSPGIPFLTTEIQSSLKKGKHITSATNIFFSRYKGTIIGITGTKGKSTTTSLIYHILKSHNRDVQLVGNIGLPMLDYLDNATTETIFVTELSSYQLEDCRYSPHIAVLLEIVPEHLTHHGSFEQYVLAKANITAHQSDQDVLIYNPEHTETAKIANNSKAQKKKFSLEPDPGSEVYYKENAIYANDSLVIKQADIPLLGRGNLENTLAAVTTTVQMKIPLEQISQQIKTFQSLEHRLEKVGTFNSITFYNDSIATTPEATINALEALGNSVETLIAGGYERNLDYSKLIEFIRNSSLKTLILFPTTGTRIAEELRRDKPKDLTIYQTESMHEAVELAYKHTQNGKICLLSPAAASYNTFKNFEDRGKQFKQNIKELAHKR